jgi:hypothetical protein
MATIVVKKGAYGGVSRPLMVKRGASGGPRGGKRGHLEGLRGHFGGSLDALLHQRGHHQRIVGLRARKDLVHLALLIQGTFREHSENIQGTFREHSGNM